MILRMRWFGTTLAIRIFITRICYEDTLVKNTLIAVYILAVLAISAVARAGVLPNLATEGEETTSPASQGYDFKTRVGTLVVLEDGSFGLMINSRRTLVLQSQGDLSSFIGSKVMISGVEVDQQHVSSCGLDSKDPLPKVGPTENDLVIFFVFGISEVR